MKQFILIFTLCVFTCSCSRRIPINEKFNEIQSTDYSIFSGIKIEEDKRHWVRYIVTFDNNSFLIWHGLMDKVKIIKMVSLGDSIVVIPYSVLDNLQKAIAEFTALSVSSLSVDDFGNVSTTLYWHDQCIYKFIRVQPGYTIDEVKEIFGKEEDYTLYRAGWYVCRECSGSAKVP